MQRVIITDPVDSTFFEGLEQIEMPYLYAPTISYADLSRQISRYTGLVVRSRLPIDRKLLEKAENLSFIARAGSGMENIDVQYAENYEIRCFNAGEGNKDAVAEHALGMLLTLLHNIHRSSEQVRRGKWKRDENRGTELKGKTVGIIGFGNTGQAFAEKLKGLGTETLVYDKYKSGFRRCGVTEVDLSEIFRQADVVSLHVPLTQETVGMVDKEFFHQLEHPVIFINTSRGQVVNTPALAEAIQRDQVKGACLDVLEEEGEFDQNSPYYQDYRFLRNHSSVILTPHIAGWTHESNRKISEVLLRKMRNVLQYPSVQ